MAEKKIMTAQDREARSLRRRRSYIAGRLPELKEELGALKTERKTFKANESAVKDSKSSEAKDLKSPEVKNLNRRRRFVKSRIEDLQKEKEGLMAERKTMKAAKGKTKAAEA